MPRNAAGSNTILVMTYFFCYSYSSVNVTLIMANFLYLNICDGPAFVNGDVVNAQNRGKPREKCKQAILRQRQVSSLLPVTARLRIVYILSCSHCQERERFVRNFNCQDDEAV